MFIKKTIFVLLLVFFTNSAFADFCSITKQALKSAEKIRNLKAKRKVPCFVHNKKQVEKYLRDTIEEKIPASKLAAEEKLFKAVGLIPKDYSYKEEIIKLYLSQLAGYYEPVREHYVMAGWLPSMMQDGITVHELVHAIQDHHYNLDEFLDPTSLTTDEGLARSAVIEGDATLVMYDHMNKQMGQGKFQDQEDVSGLVLQVVASSAISTEFKKAPRALQGMLLFPYTSGTVFAHAIIKGTGYDSLAKVYKKLPKSTKEILHPKLYLEGWKPEVVTKKTLAKMLNIDIDQITYEDRLGEFVVSTITSSYLGGLSAKLESDLAVLYKKGAETRAAWLLRWEDSVAREHFRKSFLLSNKENIIQIRSSDDLVVVELKTS